MKYSNQFLGRKIIEPKASTRFHRKELTWLDYTHFSVLFYKPRAQPLYTVVNINGPEYKISKRKKSDQWLFDALVPQNCQLGDWFYKNTGGNFHRGHLVRRLDPCWGHDEERKAGEADTFHFTNASPQHKKFNPQIWLELEKYILDNAAAKGEQCMTVFSGPVLRTDDRFFMKPVNGQLIQIPVSYWKAVVWKRSDQKLSAVFFIQSQFDLVKGLLRSFKEEPKRGLAAYDHYLQNIEFKDGRSYQVTKAQLEKATGLRFEWKNVEFPYKKAAYKELKKAEASRSPGTRGTGGKTGFVIDMVL